MASSIPSAVNARYVEPSAETPLAPGTKIADLYQRNMSDPYVLPNAKMVAWAMYEYR